MTKSNVVPVRLEPEIIKYIETRARERKLDRSTALRQLLAKGIEEDRKEKAVSLYREGKISIGRAKEIAGVSIYEMMELLKKKGVPLNLTVKAYRKSLRKYKTFGL